MQGLTIWAFCNQNFHVRTIKKILSIAPTFAILTFFQCKDGLIFQRSMEKGELDFPGYRIDDTRVI